MFLVSDPVVGLRRLVDESAWPLDTMSSILDTGESLPYCIWHGKWARATHTYQAGTTYNYMHATGSGLGTKQGSKAGKQTGRQPTDASQTYCSPAAPHNRGGWVGQTPAANSELTAVFPTSPPPPKGEGGGKQLVESVCQPGAGILSHRSPRYDNRMGVRYAFRENFHKDKICRSRLSKTMFYRKYMKAFLDFFYILSHIRQQQ